MKYTEVTNKRHTLHRDDVDTTTNEMAILLCEQVWKMPATDSDGNETIDLRNARQAATLWRQCQAANMLLPPATVEEEAPTSEGEEALRELAECYVDIDRNNHSDREHGLHLIEVVRRHMSS